MKKICAIWMCCILAFSVTVSFAASDSGYLPEGCASFWAEVQKKAADGSYISERLSSVDGELRLERTSTDLVAQMYAGFETVNSGLLRLVCDVNADITNGKIMSLSDELFSDAIALDWESDCLTLVINEERMKAGEFLRGVFHTVSLELNYSEQTLSLWVDNTPRLEDVQFEGQPLNTLSAILYGDTVGTLSWKQLSIQKSSAASVAFSDISETDAKDAILRMAGAGYLEGVGNGLFQPDAAVTRAQMAEMSVKLLRLPKEDYQGGFTDVFETDWFAPAVQAVCNSGIMVGYDGKFRPYDLVNLEETAKIFTEVSQRLNGAIVPDTVELVNLRYEKEESKDEYVLVERDAQLLADSLPTERYLFREFTLPTEGRFGSRIEWQVQNGEVDAENRLTFERTAESEKELILTATITQGDAKEEKEFRYLLYPCEVSWQSIADLSDGGNLLVPTEGRLISFSFDVIPETEKMNALIGYSNRDTQASAFSQMPIIFRLNEQGYFDCYNHNTYAADKKVTYYAGKEYQVRVIVDFLNSVYSVFVTPSGEKEVQIAKNYAFRASAGSISSIGRCYLRFGSGAESVFRVSYHSLAAPEEVKNNDQYPFDKRYYAVDTGGISPLEALKSQYFVNEDVTLPEYDAKGRQYVWVSSDPAVLSNDGKLVASEQTQFSEITMCAVVSGAKPATSAVLLQKEKISPWAIPYLLQAADIGLIQGVLNQADFDGRKPIDRAYCAVLMDRLLYAQ